MSHSNEEFMEAFKHLDKICKEIFNSEKGVTSYIDAMEKITNGDRYVSNWDYVLKRLKKLRHIRNQYAHEIGSSYDNICVPEDIEWLKSFYNEIMNTTDPLAQYRKATIKKQEKAKTTESKSMTSVPNLSKLTPEISTPKSASYNQLHRLQPNYKDENEEDASRLGIVLIFVIATLITCGILYVAFYV